MRSHLIIIDGIFRRISAKVLRIECYQMTKDNLNMAREFSRIATVRRSKSGSPNPCGRMIEPLVPNIAMHRGALPCQAHSCRYAGGTFSALKR